MIRNMDDKDGVSLVLVDVCSFNKFKKSNDVKDMPTTDNMCDQSERVQRPCN